MRSDSNLWIRIAICLLCGLGVLSYTDLSNSAVRYRMISDFCDTSGDVDLAAPAEEDSSIANVCDDVCPGAEMPSASAASSSANTLLPLTYYHIKDSDGGHGKSGVITVLLFEPNGICQLHLADDLDVLAYRGSYSYSAGKLTLKFTGSDFHPSVKFSLSTSASQVTMPFKVFSTGNGTSKWQRTSVSVGTRLMFIFKGAVINEGLSNDQAMARAVAYAQAIIAQGTTDAAATSYLGASAQPAPKLSGINPVMNGVELQYDNGPWTKVQFYGPLQAGQGATLTPSIYMTDPHVPINLPSPGNAPDDPLSKTALFICPFATTKTFVWYNQTLQINWADDPSSGSYVGFEEEYNFGEFTAKGTMDDLLTSNGYSVTLLMDTKATTLNIIKDLVKSPGILVFASHGGSDGGLVTADVIGGPSSSTTQRRDSFMALMKAIDAAGYGDLVKENGHFVANPSTMDIVQVAREHRSDLCDYFVELKPEFWNRMREFHKLDLSRSMVIIAACLTDATSNLRTAIRSRAYFAFSQSVPVPLGGAIFKYLCKSLVRNTHTAEESYYNIFRISSTRQMIYQEDTLFQKVLPAVAPKNFNVRKLFTGYGFSGSGKPYSYQTNGWLKDSSASASSSPPGSESYLATRSPSQINPGYLWWVLFAARWGSTANDGAQNLKTCWDELWKAGHTAGLGDGECWGKDPGVAPTEEEVAYASYLLTGTPVISIDSKTEVPRWTLNDKN